MLGKGWREWSSCEIAFLGKAVEAETLGVFETRLDTALDTIYLVLTKQ